MRCTLSAISQADSIAPARGLDELLGTLDHRTRDRLERRWTARPKGRGWLVRRALVAADLAGLFAAFLVSHLLFGGTMVGGGLGANAEVVVFLLTLPAWVVLAKLHGLYDRDEERADHSTVDDLVGVFHLVTLGAWLVLRRRLVNRRRDPEPEKLATFWALAIVLVTVGAVDRTRSCRRSVALPAEHAHRRRRRRRPAGRRGSSLQHPEYGINLVGFVDDEPRERRGDLEHVPLLGAPDELAGARRSARRRARRHRVLERRRRASTLRARPRAARARRPDRHRAAAVRGRRPERRRPHRRGAAARRAAARRGSSPSSLRVKRAIDVVGATLGLVLTAPLFAVHRVADQARLAGPGLLPPDAARA